MSATLQPASDRPEVAVVRHPIADVRSSVVGYELRLDGAVDLGDPARDAKITSALLVEAFGDIGLERLGGRHPAWITMRRGSARCASSASSRPATSPSRASSGLSAPTSAFAQAAALRQLGVLRIAPHRRVRARGARAARRAHRAPLGDGDDDLRDPRRPGRARGPGPAPRPHVRGAGRQRLPEERETRFTIGLFSVADVLLDAPMTEVLDSLPLHAGDPGGAAGRAGPKGELLSAVIAYERGDFSTLAPGGSDVALAGAYRAALEWADETSSAMA